MIQKLTVECEATSMETETLTIVVEIGQKKMSFNALSEGQNVRKFD